MYDVDFVPTPKYVPTDWRTVDLGQFVQYDPDYFREFQIPGKQRMGLKCIRPKGKIPQPVGLTDYGYMFADTKLGSVDMTGWDFSEVESLAGFYMNCKRLDDVVCDGLDLSSCVEFYRMFYNCDGLKVLDAGSWILDEISTAEEMFAECNDLQVLTIKGWNAAKLDTARSMCENCKSLKKLDLSGWVTPDLNAINRMCKGCKKLTYANIQFTNVKGLIDLDRCFMDCESLKTVVLPDFNEMPKNHTLYLMFDGAPRRVWPQEYHDFMEKRAMEKKRDKSGWF